MTHQKEKDHGAGLIHQAIPTVEGTEPRLSKQQYEFIAISFTNRIEQLKMWSRRARTAYKGDYNAPCQAFADACDEAVAAFERRLESIIPKADVPRCPRCKNTTTTSQLLQHGACIFCLSDDELLGYHGTEPVSEASGSAQSEAKE